MRFGYHFWRGVGLSRWFGFYVYIETNKKQYGFHLNLENMMFGHDCDWYDGEWNRYGIGPFQFYTYK